MASGNQDREAMNHQITTAVSTTTTAIFETMENRRLLSGTALTGGEQYMLELINRARANPGVEAARLNIDLNEGLNPNTISDTARQPLAPSTTLTAAARDHVQWLHRTDNFSHTGANSSSPHQRMAAAGYATQGSFASGENLAVTMSSGSLSANTAEIEKHHRELFRDVNVQGRGHRLNLLKGSWSEMGSGIAEGGGYERSGRSWNAVLSGQNFANLPARTFLTGVAFSDEVRDDDFYTPGEGLSGATVTATHSDGRTFTTTTAAAGGYALDLPAGTYKVTATGGGLGGTVTFEDVTIGDANVKRDFTPDAATDDEPVGHSGLPAWLSADAGRLIAHGTDAADSFSLYADGDRMVIVRNGESADIASNHVKSVEVYGKAGNDVIDIGKNLTGHGGRVLDVYAHGGAGDDTIAGGDGHDVLVGADGRDELNGRAGHDKLDGGRGNDLLMGKSGNDRLLGGIGSDRLYGGGDHDRLEGGVGEDRLFAGWGNDVLFGGSHSDTLYGQDGDDLMFGGRGNDLLVGGFGADHLDGQQGRDTVSYAGRTNAVKITSGDRFADARGNDGEAGERDNVLFTNEILVGGEGDDWLIGHAAADNVLYGNGGGDILDGVASDNALFGGEGDDVLFAHDDHHDILEGGAGTDAAWADPLDTANTLESIAYRRHASAA